MQEYRAQLDAERASKLARGKNHAPPSTKSKDKDKKREHTLSYDESRCGSVLVLADQFALWKKEC